MTFSEKLLAAQSRSNSWLCVGLDTDPAKLPDPLQGRAGGVLAFNQAIVDATSDIACAYKPNFAFYLAQGVSGMDALSQTVASIPHNIPILLDAKFGDIDSSAQGYASFAFETLGADAVTVSPYLGTDALQPFLNYADRAVFVLAHTSNRGSSQLQDLLIGSNPLYIEVSRMSNNLEEKAEVGLVVGATFPEQLRDAREVAPRALFLIPGIGAQGGSLEAAVRFGKNDAGVGPLINISRSILYASSGRDYALAARAAALKTRDEINALRGATHE